MLKIRGVFSSSQRLAFMTGAGERAAATGRSLWIWSDERWMAFELPQNGIVALRKTETRHQPLRRPPPAAWPTK